MSKQYLTAHIIDRAHSSDVYAIAVTPKHLLSGSGESCIKVWDVPNPDHNLIHEFKDAHRLGVHHISARKGKNEAVSVGFEGTLKLWDLQAMSNTVSLEDGSSDIWAVALSPEGRLCRNTTHDGRIIVRDTRDIRHIAAEYQTKGSFGLCLDTSADGRFTVSGHENGGIHVFNNESGRILHSLFGLIKPIRAVAFSPGGRLIAAGGESNIVAIYDAISGEQIANFTGHNSWVFSLDFSETGQYLLSGSYDGKVKVWSIEQKACVATHSNSDSGLYAVRWLPRLGSSLSEGFVTGGADQSIVFYREAAGS